jgi:plastocyanin domain-containing protein
MRIPGLRDVFLGGHWQVGLPVDGVVVPFEFMPGLTGEHEFSCQMGMLRGRIMVEEA